MLNLLLPCTALMTSFFSGFVLFGRLGAFGFSGGDPVLQVYHRIHMSTSYDIFLSDSLHLIKNLMQNVDYQIVKDVHGIAGLPIAVGTFARFIVADITDTLPAYFFAGRILADRAVGGQSEPATAVSAEDVA